MVKMTVGEKFEQWWIQRNSLEADEEQAFCAGHVAGAQHRHDEVHALLEKVDTLFDAIKHGDRAHQEWLKAAIRKHFGLDESLIGLC